LNKSREKEVYGKMFSGEKPEKKLKEEAKSNLNSSN